MPKKYDMSLMHDFIDELRRRDQECLESGHIEPVYGPEFNAKHPYSNVGGMCLYCKASIERPMTEAEREYRDLFLKIVHEPFMSNAQHI